VIVPWTAIPGSNTGELSAKFDIVANFTPSENTTPSRPTLVAVNPVVSGASFQPGVAAGSWITLFGNGLAGTSRTSTSSEITNGTLPSKLDGVEVQVNSKPASVYYISPTQLNVQAPSDSSTGNIQVRVTNSAGSSDSVTVELKPFMPAFFQFSQEYVAAVRADGAYIGPEGLMEGVTTVPARPNDQILLFGTGFGPTNLDVQAGQTFTGAPPLANPVTIRIDNTAAQVSFAGLSSPGLYQFNITVPDLPDGDYAITAEIGGTRTIKIARLRIQRTASTAAVVRPPARSIMDMFPGPSPAGTTQLT
jgi:uncharacterized protein (TIGR03437 family)